MPDDLIDNYEPDFIAETKRYNRERNQWVQQYGTLDGFDEWFVAGTT